MRCHTIRAIAALLCLLLMAGCSTAPVETEQTPGADKLYVEVKEEKVPETATEDNTTQTGTVPTPTASTAPPPAVSAAPTPTASAAPTPAADAAAPGYVDAVTMEAEGLESEAEALQAPAEPALPDILEPVASGVLVKENGKAKIDYSNTADGYIMVKYTAGTNKKLKVQIKGLTTTYTYNLKQGEWEVYPLTDGEGSYQFKVFENVTGTKYALALSMEHNVDLTDEFAPFLRPNQFVDFNASSKTVAKAKELTAGIEEPLKKVAAIYDYVVKDLSYDKEKAKTVTSGYLPVLDTVLEEHKGICFDYAALMTGMLRSQGVPCKMVFGYAGTAYHAWINVWTEDTGWIDGAIFFNGTTWQRMDPTFASSGKQSQSIMAYIGNGANYTDKYYY